MSSEGVTLVMRAALGIFLIVVASFFLALFGPGRRRGRIMLAGTLGGISLGVFVAYLISHWIRTDVSAICAVLGMPLGWGVSCDALSHRRVDGSPDHRGISLGHRATLPAAGSRRGLQLRIPPASRLCLCDVDVVYENTYSRIDGECRGPSTG